MLITGGNERLYKPSFFSRIREALEITRDSNAPAAKILYAGLERHDEGTEQII